jgi:hypothetical protein
MKALWDSIPKGAERTRVANAFRAAETRVKDHEAATNQPPNFASSDDEDDDGPPLSDDERAASAGDPKDRRTAA